MSFWARVNMSAEDTGCWPWTGATNQDGYGNVWRAGVSAKAHRVAWEEAVGPIPDGLQVLHSCDNPPCCNPTHLFLGTHTDNMQDMVRKRRDGRRRLDEEDVREARQAWRAGQTQRKLAEHFGVSEATIFMAVHGRTWRHVPDTDARKPKWSARGERVGSSKLTDANVREILRRLAAGEKQSALALEFGVVHQLVSQIAHGRIWKHLDVAS